MENTKKGIYKATLLVLLAIIIIGLLIPSQMTIPVKGASSNDWHPDTFWYEPWGSSGVHKGIDIFASKGTPVIAATSGLVLYSGEWQKGGHVVVVLGPKWRIHYYAHLASRSVSSASWISKQEQLGTLGDTGNAAGKPPHLHYSLVTLLPYLWRYSTQTQGWKQLFYLDPNAYLSHS
ncbi:M23 family metallopeptidase [Corallincola luteus]|uniref:M23 family metallopeptidase n=1 Tax=Corallincola luteus TaxID=1775177 RepID=A0ABY2ARS4_9GAMM|nr:M23 family metallopeptidase [Corallincola luteus]TCI05158.1 M23 family metallopeptidase [Corallincola luteus]